MRLTPLPLTSPRAPQAAAAPAECSADALIGAIPYKYKPSAAVKHIAEGLAARMREKGESTFDCGCHMCRELSEADKEWLVAAGYLVKDNMKTASTWHFALSPAKRRRWVESAVAAVAAAPAPPPTPKRPRITPDETESDDTA